jgi:hypothetical protein
MIDFGGHDQLPAIGIEQRYDRLFDIFLADVIAVADDHRAALHPRVRIEGTLGSDAMKFEPEAIM